jgi:hypothetical protein
LIDMVNSILVLSGHCGPHAQLDGAPSKAVRRGGQNYGFVIYFLYFSDS